jgi:glycerate kinase
MRVLVAFDKFKHALAAPAACAAAAGALGSGIKTDSCPLTDGGEGFCGILTAAAGGKLVEHTVTGPRGARTPVAFGLVQLACVPAAARRLLDLSVPGEHIAIVEMALASGLALLPPAQRDPWLTTSLGTGELIRAAMQAGAGAVLLGVGGSATNDLGAGALTALGLQFHLAGGNPVPVPVPATWAQVTEVRGQVIPGLPQLRIACDVTNPLLGPQGCTAVYGPQKGLREEDRARLEGECDRMSALLCSHHGRPLALRDTPGAGAAGGISFGLQCAAGAQLLPGFDFVSAWFDLDARLAAADVVVTGEGRFDDSSLSGKGPGALVRRALALGKEVHVFAGQIGVTAPPAGLHLHAITAPGSDLAAAMAATSSNLTTAIQRTFSSP